MPLSNSGTNLFHELICPCGLSENKAFNVFYVSFYHLCIKVLPASFCKATWLPRDYSNDTKAYQHFCRKMLIILLFMIVANWKCH